MIIVMELMHKCIIAIITTDVRRPPIELKGLAAYEALTHVAMLRASKGKMPFLNAFVEHKNPIIQEHLSSSSGQTSLGASMKTALHHVMARLKFFAI